MCCPRRQDAWPEQWCERTGRIHYLHRSGNGWDAQTDYTQRAIVPARLVAGQEDACIHWAAEQRIDIYTVPAAGGPEVRITEAKGLDDGPEYTPDGKYIYFNSARTGTMQIYRMKPDGTEQQAITNGEFNDWFPHISPDGKWLLFISFLKEEVKADDHPFYKHVYLRMLPISGTGQPKVLAYIYGGQGTINTPSWSPDSKRVAFISNSAETALSPVEK